MDMRIVNYAAEVLARAQDATAHLDPDADDAPGAFDAAVERAMDAAGVPARMRERVAERVNTRAMERAGVI
jgi:hypothetical protein